MNLDGGGLALAAGAAGRTGDAVRRTVYFETFIVVYSLFTGMIQDRARGVPSTSMLRGRFLENGVIESVCHNAMTVLRSNF